MVRIIIFLSLMVFSVATALSNLDPVTGIWEGTYTSERGDHGFLVSKVIALGQGEYLAVIEIDDARQKVELPGRKMKKGVFFSGSLDLGIDLGGSYLIEATAEGGNLKGKFTGESAEGTLTLRKVTRRSPTLGAEPPDGAVVLFDGSGLDNWTRVNGDIPLWQVLPNGAMEVGQGNIITKKAFENARIHLEFRTPFMPEARGQARGNSGVYLQGRYEVQVLDSFGLEPKNNECGGIYEVAVPLVNACLPPLQWQTYDIEFLAPRFDESGKKTAGAIMSVRLNGVLVHDRISLPGPTRSSVDANEVPRAGLMLQDHGNPVQYRNIWALPISRNQTP